MLTFNSKHIIGVNIDVVGVTLYLHARRWQLVLFSY